MILEIYRNVYFFRTMRFNEKFEKSSKTKKFKNLFFIFFVKLSSKTKLIIKWFWFLMFKSIKNLFSKKVSK